MIVYQRFAVASRPDPQGSTNQEQRDLEILDSSSDPCWRLDAYGCQLPFTLLIPTSLDLKEA